MTNLVPGQQISLLLELLELLRLLELLARPRLGDFLDGSGVVRPQLLLDGRRGLLGDGLVRLVVLGLVVEEPVGQPVAVLEGILVVPLVDDVVSRLLAAGQLVG
jgi:hypothetical protein